MSFKSPRLLHALLFTHFSIHLELHAAWYGLWHWEWSILKARREMGRTRAEAPPLSRLPWASSWEPDLSSVWCFPPKQVDSFSNWVVLHPRLKRSCWLKEVFAKFYKTFWLGIAFERYLFSIWIGDLSNLEFNTDRSLGTLEFNRNQCPPFSPLLQGIEKEQLRQASNSHLSDS